MSPSNSALGTSAATESITTASTAPLAISAFVISIACSAVHHLAEKKFTDAAWCQARARLPIEVIQQVHEQVIGAAERELEKLAGSSACSASINAAVPPAA